MPPWQIDPRPIPRWIWFARWRLFTRLRNERRAAASGASSSSASSTNDSDEWDWEGWDD